MMSKEEKKAELANEIRCANSKYLSSLVLVAVGTFTLVTSALVVLVNFDFYLREGFSLADSKTTIAMTGIIAGAAFSIGGSIRAHYFHKKKKNLVNQLKLTNS